MARSRDERPEYVAELAVTGVAVLTVRAESENGARLAARSRVRPVDVTELDAVTVRRIVRVSKPVPTAGAPSSSASPETASKGRRSGRQT